MHRQRAAASLPLSRVSRLRGPRHKANRPAFHAILAPPGERWSGFACHVAGAPLEVAALAVHDSAMYCVWPSDAQGKCDEDSPAAKDCPN